MAVVRPANTLNDGGDAIPSTPLSEPEWDRVVGVLGLSRQQTKIVRLILQGMRDKQIAIALGLRVATVRTHLTRLFARISVADRVELILRVFAICRQGAGCN